MKKHLLLLLLPLTLIGGTVSDHAGLLGNSLGVSADIANQPVWIETRIDTPPGGIKAYADQRVREVTDKGFYIVITTSPRAWRISMTPQNVVDPDQVLKIGERMVPEMRVGNFQGAFIGAAAELTRALQLGAKPQEAEESWTWLWWTLGIVGVIGVAWGAVAALYRARSRAREDQARRETARFQRESASARLNFREAHNTKKRAASMDAKSFYASFDSDGERRAVTKAYESDPRFSSDIYNDPVMFWWYWSTVIQPSYAAPDSYPASYSSGISSSPEPEKRHRSSDSDSSPSYSPPSSDSGGSSGGYDSGGSSGGGDSGGASGSW